MKTTNVGQKEFLRPVCDPDRQLTRILHEYCDWPLARGRYALCIGSTGASDLDGISAAGSDGEARRLTPAIDAEALVLGTPRSARQLPVSPSGIVSPVVLSRAMMDLLNCSIEVFDCGAFYPPQIEHRRVGVVPAASPNTGTALSFDTVMELFASGRQAAKELVKDVAYVLVGECVPGGTTTALGVLTALGYPADMLVSSSMPFANHDRRSQIIRLGLESAGFMASTLYNDPLLAVGAVGDPMQPFVAGLAIEASKHLPVVLGGGTQMLAVYALISAIEGRELIRKRPIVVITTKWVAFDSQSNPVRLAELVGSTFAASCPDFHRSRHRGLRAYEQGHVKEGIAAGALMALAHLSGRSVHEIYEAIDEKYSLMVYGVSE